MADGKISGGIRRQHTSGRCDHHGQSAVWWNAALEEEEESVARHPVDLALTERNVVCNRVARCCRTIGETVIWTHSWRP
jgi:hypothetical protein